jgi:acyl-CoA reductase-like NAD-dependent aldehyde dehydrogenase
MEQICRVYAPFDGHLISEIECHNSVATQQIVESAFQYYQDRDAWLKPHQRVQILSNFLEKIKENEDSLAEIAAQEGGKPIRDTYIELNRAKAAIVTAIETIPQITGREIPMGLSKESENRMAYTFREPCGVVFAISGFSHPINLIIHHITPAIAVGCPVIIKPSLKTPLSCIRLLELLNESGAPKPLCQLILLEDEETEKLCADNRIHFLSFTGASSTGWYLRSLISPGAQSILIHGGACPVIVDENCHLDKVASLIVRGGFYHSGQIGASVQRVYVHHKILKALSKKLVDLSSKLIVGDPLSADTDMGALIDKQALSRIEAWVNQALDNGTKCLFGGQREGENGFQPTILLEPSQDLKVSQEEVFGPVICLYSYKDRIQAINQANSLPFCFHAAVMSDDLNIAMDTVKRLNATCVMVNDHSAFHVDWMPYGGRKHSGTGVGGIVSSMKALSFEKLMVMRLESYQT